MDYHLDKQLQDLLALILQLDEKTYSKKSSMLGDISIGQHARHIIELIQCLAQGYEEGIINYEARKRDVRIEHDKNFASHCITQLIEQVNHHDKPLLLIDTNDPLNWIPSHYSREVVYNTEHAIHHMALIRVALREMKLDMVDDNFGVAPSTERFKKQLLT